MFDIVIVFVVIGRGGLCLDAVLFVESLGSDESAAEVVHAVHGEENSKMEHHRTNDLVPQVNKGK